MNLNFENLINTEFRDIKYSKLSIGTNTGKNIESAISIAEKFVYIISPYFSPNKINLLENLDKNIDKKLILCDNSEFFSLDSLKSIKELLCYDDHQVFSIEKQNKENKKNKDIEKNKKNKKKWFFVTIFISFLLGLFFYLKIFPSFNFIILLFLFFVSICGFFSCKFKIDFIKNKYIDDIENLKNTIIPNMKWKFDIKIIRAYKAYKKTPYTHLKLYLMDCPKLSKTNNKTVIRAFLSSANFTENGFKNNLEFLFETTDFKTTNELFNFFNNTYYGTQFEFHQFEFLVKVLFKNKIIKNLE